MQAVKLYSSKLFQLLTVCQLTHFDHKMIVVVVVVVVVFNLLKFQERSTSISRVEENLWPYWVSLHAPQAHSR